VRLKFRSTKVDAGDIKHELLNRLRSTMAVNVLRFHGVHKTALPLLFNVTITLACQSFFDEFSIVSFLHTSSVCSRSFRTSAESVFSDWRLRFS